MSTSNSWPPATSRPPSHPPGSYPPGSSSSRSHHPSSSSVSRSQHPGSTSTPTSTSTSATSTASSHQYHHEEDRLGRAWRTLASSVVMSTQKAEKAATAEQPTREHMKELNDAVVTFLRARMEWGRQISYIEAKLQGKAQENETMDCYLRCQPKMGRKRKRQEEVVVVAEDIGTSAPLLGPDTTAANPPNLAMDPIVPPSVP